MNVKRESKTFHKRFVNDWRHEYDIRRKAPDTQASEEDDPAGTRQGGRAGHEHDQQL